MSDRLIQLETESFGAHDVSIESNDGFVIDWANEVALGGPDTTPDDGGFIIDWADQVALEGNRAATASSPTGEDVMCSNNLGIAVEDDSFIIIDYLPEYRAPSGTSDGLLPMESLSPVDPSDPSAELRPMESITPVGIAGTLFGDGSCPILSDALFLL